jgi:hypothetical protein
MFPRNAFLLETATPHKPKPAMISSTVSIYWVNRESYSTESYSRPFMAQADISANRFVADGTPPPLHLSFGREQPP